MWKGVWCTVFSLVCKYQVPCSQTLYLSCHKRSLGGQFMTDPCVHSCAFGCICLVWSCLCLYFALINHHLIEILGKSIWGPRGFLPVSSTGMLLPLHFSFRAQIIVFSGNMMQMVYGCVCMVYYIESRSPKSLRVDYSRVQLQVWSVSKQQPRQKVRCFEVFSGVCQSCNFVEQATENSILTSQPHSQMCREGSCCFMMISRCPHWSVNEIAGLVDCRRNLQGRDVEDIADNLRSDYN